MKSDFPRLLVDVHEAHERVVALLQEGEEILAIDPAKDEQGKHLSEIQMLRDSSRLVRKRTDEWRRKCLGEFKCIFESPPLSQFDLLSSSSGIYPKVGRLRSLRNSLQDATQPRVAVENSHPDFIDVHPSIEEHCRRLYSSEHYDEAVFNAFKTVEAAIRAKSGANAEDVGTALVSKVMNPKAPIITFSSIAAEQEAFHSLYRGAIGAFKNPHSHRFMNIGTPHGTLDLLRFASLLLRLLDEAKT